MFLSTPFFLFTPTYSNLVFWTDTEGRNAPEKIWRTPYIFGLEQSRCLHSYMQMNSGTVQKYTYIYMNPHVTQGSFPYILPALFPVSGLPRWSRGCCQLWSRVRLCTTALTCPSSCCRPEVRRNKVTTLWDGVSLKELRMSFFKMSEVLSHLAFQHNAALWCHLITQILDKVRTWNSWNNENQNKQWKCGSVPVEVKHSLSHQNINLQRYWSLVYHLKHFLSYVFWFQLLQYE